MGLELLELLQVGRLKRRVQEGRGGSAWGWRVSSSIGDVGELPGEMWELQQRARVGRNDPLCRGECFITAAIPAR